MPQDRPKVLIETSEGDIEVELWQDRSPRTVENFLQYVDEGFYDGTVFHRIIPNFMIQGGGLDRDLNKKRTHRPIQNEATTEKKNERGTLAMARTTEIDSATAQFFINLADNDFLDHTGEAPDQYGYAAFGEVTDGMDVVDKIAKVETTQKEGRQNVPVRPVLINSIRRTEN